MWHLKLELFKIILHGNTIFQHYYLYCIFDQLNATLVSIIDFFQKHLKKILLITNFSTAVSQFWDVKAELLETKLRDN